MPSRPVSHLLCLLPLLVAIALGSGCGRKSGGESAPELVEKHVVATETFGVMLADVQTSADWAKAQPELVRQARVVADTMATLTSHVLDNAQMTDAQRMAALEPFQMRLAAAERLWRQEAERLLRTLGPNALSDVNAALGTPR